MSNNLKVNAKTKPLEFKKKHNLLVEEVEKINYPLEQGLGLNSIEQKTIDAEEPNVASGNESVALNHETKSVQKGCTAIGGGTQAGKTGYDANTYGFCFACGEMTKSLGRGSFAEGNTTIAEGMYTHSAGYKTTAKKDWQFIVGAMNWYSNTDPAEDYLTSNLSNIDNAIFIVGNGYEQEIEGETPEENYWRITGNDAFAVYKDGHAELDAQGNTEKSVVIKSGLKLHCLHIIASEEGLNCFAMIFNTDKTLINTKAKLVSYLLAHDFTSANKVFPCNGNLTAGQLVGLYLYSENIIKAVYISSILQSVTVTITAIGDNMTIA